MVDDPFDPPKPPGTSPGELAQAVVGVAVVVAVDVATDGLLTTLRHIPAGPDLEANERLRRYQAEIEATTSPPRIAEDGRVACTHCGERVAFEEMKVNQHGYFCLRCARSSSER